MRKFIILIACCILQSFCTNAFASISDTHNSVYNNYLTHCNEEVQEKDGLIVDWYVSKPYQFGRIGRNGRYIVQGLDIDLINALSSKVGVNLKYVETVWERAITNVESGKGDLLAGATYTDERATFAVFSLPYRYEEISLFTLKEGQKKLQFNNTDEFLAQIRLLNFRLGIIKKAVYGNTEITEYMNKPSNNDIIIKYPNDTELLRALIRKEIDGYLTDRITGVAMVLSEPNKELIQEIPLGLKTPVHLMFSKKTVSVDVIEKFNSVIKEFINSDTYKKIVKDYIYRVLLPKAVDSDWCYIIGLIGSIAFAISGIVIAVRENATFFGTFILALLPSILGCIFLDLTIDNTEDFNLNLTPTYTYHVFLTVFVGFSTIKLLHYYNNQLYEDGFIRKVWSNTLVICDSLGQASFIVIGVVMVVVQGLEPLKFWGPCFACLTSGIGMVLRELICNHNISVALIRDRVNLEISILWGLVFSVLLDINYYNPDDSTIKYSIITVIAGAFITKLFVHYYNIGNLVFRNDDKRFSE